MKAFTAVNLVFQMPFMLQVPVHLVLHVPLVLQMPLMFLVAVKAFAVPLVRTLVVVVLAAHPRGHPSAGGGGQVPLGVVCASAPRHVRPG